MGRPAHKPSEARIAKVRELAAKGVSQARIAAAIGIGEKTLREYYRKELDECAGIFDAELESCIGNVALDPDPKNNTLRIFLAKTRLGYRELTPKDPDRKALDDITDDELAAMVGARARERRTGGEGGAGDSEAPEGTPEPRRIRA